MPQVVVSRLTLADLARLRCFLRTKNEVAAARARRILISAINRLGQNPKLGRSVADGLRVMTVSFGQYGYQIAYVCEEHRVYILALKSGREEGFG
ncbi:hypothetical protein FACS189460_1750 [Deltaproteobacteria bacterium]|nr:hypothetical protein FACS189460_1750 [Deltaproteobacteria bacterium]